METKLLDKKEIASAPSVPRNDGAIKKLLDVISSIMADEYIEVAKQNLDVFKNGGQK